jgi:hypothetical protein
MHQDKLPTPLAFLITKQITSSRLDRRDHWGETSDRAGSAHQSEKDLALGTAANGDHSNGPVRLDQLGRFGSLYQQVFRAAALGNGPCQQVASLGTVRKRVARSPLLGNWTPHASRGFSNRQQPTDECHTNRDWFGKVYVCDFKHTCVQCDDPLNDC